MNTPVNLDIITLKEKCLLLLIYTETTSKKHTYHCARIVFPHLSKYRVQALLQYFDNHPLEFYVSQGDIQTRMF
jgi:DNA polymerase III epsilon subunit-like protein